jgi:hypothetical protein
MHFGRDRARCRPLHFGGELTAFWMAFRTAVEVIVAVLTASMERVCDCSTREISVYIPLLSPTLGGWRTSIFMYFPPDTVTRTWTDLFAAMAGGGGWMV